jgi:hypothetical protein
VAASNLHIEIAITDSQRNKRRLIFHQGAKDLVINPLHSRMPINIFHKNEWLNLSIDVFAFADFCFKGVLVRSIDFVKIAGPCRIRRIFSMLNPLFDDETEFNEELQVQLDGLQRSELRASAMFEHVPKQIDFPPQAQHFN